MLILKQGNEFIKKNSFFDLTEDNLNELYAELIDIAKQHSYSKRFTKFVRQLPGIFPNETLIGICYLKSLRALFIRQGLWTSSKEKEVLIPALNNFLSSKLMFAETESILSDTNLEIVSKLRKAFQCLMAGVKFLDLLNTDIDQENYHIIKKVLQLYELKSINFKNEELKKEEIAICTLKNLVRALILYLQKYIEKQAGNNNKIKEKAEGLRRRVLIPLIHQFINPARNCVGLEKYQKKDIQNAIKEYDRKVQHMVVQYAVPSPKQGETKPPTINQESKVEEYRNDLADGLLMAGFVTIFILSTIVVGLTCGLGGVVLFLTLASVGGAVYCAYESAKQSKEQGLICPNPPIIPSSQAPIDSIDTHNDHNPQQNTAYIQKKFNTYSPNIKKSHHSDDGKDEIPDEPEQPPVQKIYQPPQITYDRPSPRLR